MRLLALLACLVCLPLAQAQVRPYDDILESGVLKVAVYENFAPYSFLEEGRGRGVDVDLARALAESLGLKLELLWVVPGEKLDDDLRNFVWKGHYLRPGVLADVMLRVPYDRDFSQKRNDLGELANEQVVIFSPYQRERWQVAYDSRRLAEVPSIGVFQFHPIGVELESVPSFYLTSVFGGRLARNTRHYPGPAAAFEGMRMGEVDAVMALRGELDWLERQARDPQIRNADGTYPNLGRPDWDIGMAVHESNRQLANALEETIEGMVRDGRMEELYAGYGLHYELPGLYQDVR